MATADGRGGSRRGGRSGGRSGSRPSGASLLALTGLLVAGVDTAQPGQDDYTGVVVFTTAVVGGRANLPCSLTSDKPGDQPVLVLWYRGTSGAPIYSFDARQKSLSDGVQWKDDFILANRNAEFLVTTAPPVLAIDDVRETDGGVYWCRVDFQKTPTQYSGVNLTVIVPPDRPVIRLRTGDRVGDILGPLTEGDQVQLICETRGGRPKPSLSWWRGPTLISNAHLVTSSGALQNVLTLPAISRADVDQTLSCHATNNNISKPLSRSVVLKTYFRPLYVRLEGNNQPLSLGRVHHVTCRTAGSRPQPEVTWWMNDRRLQDFTIQTSLDGNETTSVLSLNASREHNNQHLICRVENPELPGTSMEDAWRITVKYPPEVSLNLGHHIDPTQLREGDDVYFECRVNANPWIHKMEWLHDGTVLQHNQRDGVIMSATSLALQGVSRQKSGHYVCRVANSEGENVSNPIRLNIQHAPACKSNQHRQYHVAKYEQVTIPCQVESNPPDVVFRWRLNNSREVVDISADRFHSSATVSELTMTPSTDLDFGTLECRGVNSIGDQEKPCLFDIIAIANPVGAPETPTHCSIRNRTQASLHIVCASGASGGYPQLFHLEAYQAQTHVLLSNLTSRRPEFVLGSLAPGEAVVVHVYSVSDRGKSGLVTLEADTLKVAELKTRQDDDDDGLRFTPLVGILLGAIIALLLIALAVVLTLRRVKSRELRSARHETEESREKMMGTVALDGDCVGDKSPDVVPSTSTLLDKRKGGPAHHTIDLRRAQPPVPPAMHSISETVSIAPNSSLPRRPAPINYSDPRIGHTDLHTFPKSPSIDVFSTRLSQLPGFPKAPALSSELYLPYDSLDRSEADAMECDGSWQGSVV